MTIYDLAVIGGGPVGSHTAYQMADLGFDVVLLDRDAEVGRNVVCTGIVGVEAFKQHDLPMESVLHRIESVRFFSPSQRTLDYTSSEPFAYVIDRSLFDKGLLQKAIDRGVDVRLGKRVTHVQPGAHFCRITATDGDKSEDLRARAVVIATGVSYQLHGELGLSRPPAFLLALQTDVIMPGLERTEVYFNDLSHGSFAWVVPAGDSVARIGALTKSQSVEDLTRFIRGCLPCGLDGADPVIACKPIAHGLLEKTVTDRVLSVGEAAGQVKSTTGGGIFYGLMCSAVAVDTLRQALRAGDLSAGRLHRYEEVWKSMIGKEIRAGCEARKMVENLTDRHIDSMFDLVRCRTKLRGLIRQKISFDHHADLLLLGTNLLRPFIRRSQTSPPTSPSRYAEALVESPAA
ncbi:MAG: NAD(P)/FAD-dependent oxidoreductase [Candidatus Eisenbacteria bacterium]